MQVRRTLGMGIFNMVVVREQDASIYTCAYNDCRLRKIDFPPVPAPFPRVKTLVLSSDPVIVVSRSGRFVVHDSVRSLPS